MRRLSTLSDAVSLGRSVRNETFSSVRALRDDVARLETENDRKAELVEMYTREVDAMRKDLSAVYDRIGELIDRMTELQHDHNDFVREIVRLRYTVATMTEDLAYLRALPGMGVLHWWAGGPRYFPR